MAPFVETDFARQLERDLSAATARAEKVEAELAKYVESDNARTLGNYRENLKLRRERDELRKALELARPYVRVSSMQMYDGGQGADMRKTARDRLEVIDATLARTAQAQHRHEQAPNYCGNCAEYMKNPDCGEPSFHDVYSCFTDKPRADAQKGTT